MKMRIRIGKREVYTGSPDDISIEISDDTKRTQYQATPSLRKPQVTFAKQAEIRNSALVQQ